MKAEFSEIKHGHEDFSNIEAIQQIDRFYSYGTYSDHAFSLNSLNAETWKEPVDYYHNNPSSKEYLRAALPVPFWSTRDDEIFKKYFRV